MANRLKRSLNLTQLVFYGVGTIVGAGIYTVIGSAAGMAGTGVWISLLLAGAAAFITALSYAELVCMYPRAGGEYQFLKHAFPGSGVPSFIAGYLIALNAAATSATVALAFGGYLNVFVSVPTWMVAFALLALCTVVNILGIRQSTWVSIGMICIEVSGLLLLIGVGFLRGEPGEAIALPDADAVAGIFAATALIFFIYIGFEDIVNLAEEANTPKRDIPLALIISVVITSVMYFLVVWAVLAISDPQTLASSESPLTTAAAGVAPWLGNALAVAALFATASTALISLVAISRLLYGMARDGRMPAALALTLGKRQTPWVAALVLFGAACALLPLGQVKIVASISACGILVVFIGVQAAVIALRYSAKNVKRPFKVPGRIGNLPVLPVIGIAIALALLTQFEAQVYAITGGALAGGGVLYGALRLFGKRRRPRARLATS
jgi:APA family basic amino acid/polyamine antiporter